MCVDFNRQRDTANKGRQEFDITETVPKDFVSVGKGGNTDFVRVEGRLWA